MNFKHNIVTSHIAIGVSLLMLLSCTEANSNPDKNPEQDKEEPKESILVDVNATEATQKLFINLGNSAEQGVIFGQQESYMENKDKEYQSNCDISDITGEYPLIAGCDLENITNDDYAEGNWRYKRVQNMIEWVKECHKKGVTVTFSWHFREPFYGDHFYVTDMDANDPNTSAAAFKSILEGGQKHTYYKKKLVLLADFFKSLTDENGELIPVIFRPFHEFGGKWFWWGVPYYATSAEFVQNWQFMVNFLNDSCNVHNLIYAFTPGFKTEAEYLESYPGDDYVDILGFDTYTSNKISQESARQAEYNEIVSQLNIISSLAKKRGKVAALTEFGHDLADKSKSVENIYTDFYLDILNNIDGNVSYMLTWYNSDKRFTPLSSDDQAIKDDFKKFVTSDKILTAGEITSPLQ